MEPDIVSVEDYLERVLGSRVRLRLWPDESRLPLYLRTHTEYRQAELLDRPLLFAFTEPRPAATLAKEHRNLADGTRPEVVWVLPSIDPTVRRRLIRERIPFVVPHNQLFLPTAGLDLRERFSRTPGNDADKALSPSAQAVLLFLLRSGDSGVESAKGLASALDYTPMTISRALRRLEADGAITLRRSGREKRFSLADEPRKVWRMESRRLVSPVKRTLWIADPSPTVREIGLRAGLPALSAYSSLASPRTDVRAVSREEADRVAAHEHVAREDADLGVEVWSYPPRVLSRSTRVDPLSLYLSLRDERDERVRAALDEMLEHVAW